MPVDDKKVFADVHLDWVKKQGFKKVFLSIGYRGDMIRKHCQDGTKWDLEIHYLDDGPALLGTGGALRKSLAHPFETLAVTYGDTLLQFDWPDLWKKFVNFPGLGAMTIYKNAVAGHICNVDWAEPYAIYDKQKLFHC